MTTFSREDYERVHIEWQGADAHGAGFKRADIPAILSALRLAASQVNAEAGTVIPNLAIVRQPGETYLSIRDPDGDRELNDAECWALFKLATQPPRSIRGMGVPEGWVPVPSEATSAMCEAWEAAYKGAPQGSGVALAWEAAYAAMLAASPAPPSPPADLTAKEFEAFVQAPETSAPPERAKAEAVAPSDPATIFAGIRQFGLAADGADLRDLATAFSSLERDTVERCAKVAESYRYDQPETIGNIYKQKIVEAIRNLLSGKEAS